MSDDTSSSPPWGALARAALETGFPFFLAWNDRLEVTGCGADMKKVCHDVAMGTSLPALFRLQPQEREMTEAFFRENGAEGIALEHAESGRVFCGQVLNEGRQFLFLGGPAFADAVNRREAGGLGKKEAGVLVHSGALPERRQTSQDASSEWQSRVAKLLAQQAQLRLEHEEAKKLALVAARTDNAVVLSDARGRVEWVNESFTRLSGYTLEDMRGKSPGSVLQGPDTDPATAANLRECLRQHQVARVEILNYRKNHTKYWVSLVIQPIASTNGELMGFMSLGRDVTQRYREEQRRALQFSVSRIIAEGDSVENTGLRILRSIGSRLKWKAGLMWLVNPRSDLPECVQTWHDGGADVEAFLASSKEKGFQKGTGLRGRVLATCSSQWMADVTADKNFVRAKAAGRAGLRAGLAVPISNQGETLGLLEFFDDRVEAPDRSLLEALDGIGHQVGQFMVHKAGEAKLRDAYALQRTIMAGASYSIIATDPDGLIKIFNRAAEQMTGYRAEEVIDKLTPVLIHDPEEIAARAVELREELDETIAPGFEVLTAKARRGLKDEREWTYVSKDGGRVPVLLSITALENAEGGISGYVGIASDITERRHAATELLAAKEQAEAANQAKSHFLATMSHEIRTPMNGILGMLSLLTDTPLDPHQKEMMEAIRISGEALLALIDDILDLAKIEASKLQIIEEPVVLDEVLNNVADILGHTAQQKGIDLAFVVEPDVPQALMTDPGRLRQLLVNLVGNGVKFTHHGEVVVTVSVHSATEAAHAPLIEFAVTDTGVGIPIERQSELFTPFTQLDVSTKRCHGGTGLGLVICRRIVELMHGEIGLASTPGTGARFWFRLPLRPAVSPLPSWPWPGAARRMRVLVGEGSSTCRRALIKIFDGLAEPPAFAGTEMELVRHLSQPDRHFDVVFLDRRFLGRTAIAALSKLRTRVSAGACPRIVLTGSLTDSACDYSQDLEVDAFLIKPLKRSQIRELLMEHAAGRTAGGPGLKPSETLEKPAQTGRLLIVEDNEINSQLALFMAEKLGYSPNLARNGSEGVEKFMAESYDVVLMDCHMPVMDGYEATRKIREIEAEAGWTRPPIQIIAMTANAMAGERNRCLECGMNDYLSKPVKLALLKETLDKALNNSAAADIDLPETAEKSIDTTVRRLASELTPDGVAELLDKWIEDTPAELAEIVSLAGGTNHDRLRLRVHSLKGSSALFGLLRMETLCGEMERLAVERQKSGQVQLAKEVTREFERARGTLERLRDEMQREAEVRA